MKPSTCRLLFSRLLIGAVIFFNLECALCFILEPELYRAGFELTGIPGNLMVRSMGILFIMWNVPYLFAVISPIKNRISLVEAIIMQAIGLIGETLLLATLPGGHQYLLSTALRFIFFDGGGLIALFIALLLTRRKYLPSEFFTL